MMKKIIITLTLVATISLAMFGCYHYGYSKGIWHVINELEKLELIEVVQNEDGSYLFRFNIPNTKGGIFEAEFELHMLVQQFRNNELLSETYHTMSLTTLGKNWLEGIIGNAVGSDVAKYIACSNSSDTFSAAWTSIPDEITTDGLSRAAGTYTSTGDGTWNITKSFSVTGTNSTKLYGLYYASSGNYLLAAEQQGVGSQKNVENGDTLQVTVQGSVS